MNNKMFSLMIRAVIRAGYEGSERCRKKRNYKTR